MTTAYDQNRDVLNAYKGADRGILPGRYAVAVTPRDSTELPAYGRLIVTNSHASNTETITVIMASNNVDDTTTVAFAIAPVSTIELPIVVRRVISTGTGGNITAVLTHG
jgi:hypothetical protein